MPGAARLPQWGQSNIIHLLIWKIVSSRKLHKENFKGGKGKD